MLSRCVCTNIIIRNLITDVFPNIYKYLHDYKFLSQNINVDIYSPFCFLFKIVIIIISVSFHLNHSCYC